MIDINCDLCGKAEERLNRTLIEGVELNVCSDCSKFGKVIAQVSRPDAKEQHKMLKKRYSPPKKEEKVELLVEGYEELIKKKRESLGISQKDFAAKISEKESTIHKIETGSLEPDLGLARKLEKILGIKIIEQYEEKHETSKHQKLEGFTLGDFIKIKK